MSDTVQRGLRDAWVRRVVEAGGRGPVVLVAHALAAMVWNPAGHTVAYVDVTAMTGCHRVTVSQAVAKLRAAGCLRSEARVTGAGNAPQRFTLVLGFDVEQARDQLGGKPPPAGKRPPRQSTTTGGGSRGLPPPVAHDCRLPLPEPLPEKTPPKDHRMTRRVRDRVRVAARSAYEYAASAVGSPDSDPGLATEDCVKPESQGDPEQRDRVDGVLARLAASKALPARNGTTRTATLEQLVARADPACVLCRGSGLVARGATGLPCSCTSR